MHAPPPDLARALAPQPAKATKDPMSFPPGLIPQLVAEKLKTDPPYSPLRPLDIDQAGLPPTSEPDLYLKSRIDRFYAELQVTSPDALCPFWHRQPKFQSSLSSSVYWHSMPLFWPAEVVMLFDPVTMRTALNGVHLVSRVQLVADQVSLARHGAALSRLAELLYGSAVWSGVHECCVAVLTCFMKPLYGCAHQTTYDEILDHAMHLTVAFPTCVSC